MDIYPDEMFVVSGLTTGITTARTMAARMPVRELMAHRELLIEQQDATAEALQRLDRHIDSMGRQIQDAARVAGELGQVA